MSMYVFEIMYLFGKVYIMFFMYFFLFVIVDYVVVKKVMEMDCYIKCILDLGK